MCLPNLLESCDIRALTNSTIVHLLLMNYAIFDTTIAVVQTTKRSLVMEILGHLKVGILLRVKYPKLCRMLQ
jgi:hypothetical protein